MVMIGNSHSGGGDDEVDYNGGYDSVMVMVETRVIMMRV